MPRLLAEHDIQVYFNAIHGGLGFSSGMRLPEAAPVMGAGFFVEWDADRSGLGTLGTRSFTHVLSIVMRS